MNTNEIYRLIEHEKLRAEGLHKWPRDIIHAVAVLNEEAAESMDAFLDLSDSMTRLVAKSGMSTRAALNYLYHDGSMDKLKEELIQAGAMVVRCLENMDRYNECLP